MLLFVVFVFGLVFGSFVNVLVFRLPLDISLMGRSFCPKCKKKISWFDNIPLLSFFLLGRKCRSCGKAISWRYPLLELFTALGFVMIYQMAGVGDIGYLLLLLVIFCLFLAIFVIDLDRQIIPDSLVFAGYILVLLWLLLSGRGDFYNHMGAGLLSALFLLLLHLITRGKGMGLGDVKLALVGGTILGLSMSLAWLYLAFLTGALVGIILILLGRASFGKPVAFGPFLIFAFWVTVFWGENILEIVLRL